MKKALIIAGGIVAVLLVAALVIPGFLNWNQYKVQIENAVEATTGRDVAIDGDIALTLLPAPAFSVRKLSLANLPDGTASDMIILDALDVRIRLLPLLRGNVDVEKIVLVAPRFNLEVLADGRRNWDFAGQEPAAPEEQGGGLAAAVSVNQFVIEDGVIVYRDAVTGMEERIDALNAVISAESLDGPFKVKGDMVAWETPLAFAVSVGQTGNGKIPVSLDVTLSGVAADGSFRGLVDPSEPRSAEGTMKISGKHLGALIETVSRATGAEPTVVAIDQPVAINAAFIASETGFRTTALSYGIGSSRGEGHVSASWEGAPQFDVDLAFGTLDADELVPAASAEPQPKAAEQAMALPDPAMLLPGEISGQFVLSAEAVRYRERVMRQVRVAARARDGRLDLEQLRALLPGGSDVKLAGRVTQSPAGARFDGTADISANNLHGLLEWLDAVPEGLEPGRLSSFAVNGDVFLTKSEAGFKQALVRLNTSNFKGDLSLAPGTPPYLRVKGALDRFDVGYYLPKGQKCFESSKEEGKADPLAAFNGEITLTVGRLSCPETRIDNLAVDATLSKGVLTLRKFSADRAADLKLAVSGKLQDLSTTPKFDLAINAGGASLAEVERLFPGILPKPAAQLGAASFSGKVAGTPQKLATQGTLGLGGTTLSGRADVAFKAADPKKPEEASSLETLDATFTLKAASLAQFINQWDLPLTPPRSRDDKPVDVGGTVKGSMASLNLDLKGGIAGAYVATKGRINNVGESATYDLALDLDGKDLRGFVRGLGVEFDPADPNLGPIKVKATLSGGGESLAAKIPSGQAGPMIFNGATTITFAGERPTIAGDVRAGDVPLDRFMAAPPKDAKKPAGEHQWSRAPFNNDWLKAFDANFKVRADAVTLNDYRFEQPKFTVAVSNGVLEIRDLTGKLFDGDVALAMRYGGDKVSDLGLKMSLTGASADKALATAFKLKPLSGTFGFKSELTSAGASPYDLVHALTGATQVTLSEGLLRGIDLPKLSQNMKSMDSVQAFGRVLGSALSGGTTKHKGFDTTVTTEDGAFNLNDLVVELDAGKALIGGKVDLLKWQIGSKGRLQLTEHPLAPPIGVDITGGLSAPAVNYQTKDIKTYMASEISKALLQKATGGGLDQLLGVPKKTEPVPDGQTAPADQTPTQDTPAEEAPAKEDPALQLFKGIFKSLEKKDQPATE